MANWMEQAVQESQQDKKKKSAQQDIMWITPRRLSVVFVLMLVSSLIMEKFV